MSTLPSQVSPVVVAGPASRHRGVFSLYMELTKARLSLLVLMTTAVGFVMASSGDIDWILLAWTVVGTALAAGCASALNQLFEIPLDRKMHRTRNRPLPSGAISRTHGLIAATVMGIAGVLMLALLVNLFAAALALATIAIYALVYTPMKVRSTLNTLVGAVCGAIPPMIGWVAATGRLSLGAWILGAILFVWQIPHFLALAWLHREDYERGGFAMLPVIDRAGEITCRVIVVTSLILVPLALLATILEVAGIFYALGSLVLGIWMLALGVRLYMNRTHANARRVFLASITYLPLLLCLLVVDRGPVHSPARRQVPVQLASGQ